jgi:hypothetical protein
MLKECSRAENLSNFVHQLDNGLRKLVSEMIKNFRQQNQEPAQVREYSLALQTAKTVFLKEVKEMKEDSLEGLDIEAAIQVLLDQFRVP